LIDAWGRGTIKIIESCKQAGLPEPEIIEENGGMSVTLFKNKLTAEQLTKLGLNERQQKAVGFVKEKGRITNKEYQSLNSISERTASRELSELTEKKVFKSSETKGAGSYFYL
jgi:ATP-dependent DNA helicase RecG